MYILGQIWVQLCPFYFCIFRLLSASTPPYSQPQLAGSQNLFCKCPSSKNTNLFKLRPYLEEIWVKENNQRKVHSWSITWGGHSVHTGPGANAQGWPSIPPCLWCSPWEPPHSKLRQSQLLVNEVLSITPLIGSWPWQRVKNEPRPAPQAPPSQPQSPVCNPATTPAEVMTISYNCKHAWRTETPKYSPTPWNSIIRFLILGRS